MGNQTDAPTKHWINGPGVVVNTTRYESNNPQKRDDTDISRQMRFKTNALFGNANRVIFVQP